MIISGYVAGEVHAKDFKLVVAADTGVGSGGLVVGWRVAFCFFHVIFVSKYNIFSF